MNIFSSWVKTAKKTFFKDKNTTIFLSICVFLSLLPIAILLNLLITRSVNVPYWDQWSFVDLMKEYHYGTLSLYDLWVQHNEHRSFVPRSLEIGLGALTDFNFRVQTLMNIIFASGTFILIVTMLRRTFSEIKLVAVLSVVSAWILFSPVQSINWIWGFQLAFYMCAFFTVFTFWLLSRSEGKLVPTRLLIASIIVAAMATYCNGNGLLVWPIGFAILFLRRVPRNQLIIWASAAVVFIGSYLYKFHRGSGSLPTEEVIQQPVAVAKYILIYLGRSIATTPDGAMYTGLALLAVFALSVYFIVKKGAFISILGWLAIAASVLLTAILAAFSRLNFGYLHSFGAVSYTTISVLFLVVVIVLAAYALNLWSKDFKKKSLNVYLVGFFVAGMLFAIPIQAYIANYSFGLKKIDELGVHLLKVRSCVYEASSEDDDCLLSAFPAKKPVWEQVQFLRESGWSDFK